MKLALHIAGLTLMQARRRYALPAVTISIAAGVLMLLGALITGVRSEFIRSAAVIGTGHVCVSGIFKPSATRAIAALPTPDVITRAIETAVPDGASISRRDRGEAQLYGPGGATRPLLVVGVDLAEEPRLAEVIGVSELEVGEIVVFQKHAAKLNVSNGSSITARVQSAGGWTNTMDLTVTHVAADIGMASGWTTLISRSTAKQLFRRSPSSASTIQIYLDDPDKADDVLANVRNALTTSTANEVLPRQATPLFLKIDDATEESWVGHRLDVSTWDDESSFLLWILVVIEQLARLIGLGLVFLSCAGIFNTMSLMIKSREAELATLRALGMSRGQVLVMTVTEGFLVGLGAASVGGIVGFGIAGLLSRNPPAASEVLSQLILSSNISFQPKLEHLVVVVVLVSAATALAALGPANRASRVHPVVAMRGN